MSKPITSPRLCSEIQLFDLCDLDSCALKNGKFCTDSDLLTRFEAIADEELRITEQFISEGSEDSEADNEYVDELYQDCGDDDEEDG